MDMKPAFHQHHDQKEPTTLPELGPYLEQITRFVDEGMFILNADGCMVFLNAEGERILGWTSKALRGCIAHDKIHHPNHTEKENPIASCPIHKCMKDGQVFHVEEDIFVHKNGMLLPVSFISSPIRDKNQIIGSVTVFKEIGTRRESEREIKQAQDIALETARLKAEFLANMSHEIRTPINGVIGMTALLLDTKLNKEQKDLAATTRDSAQALLTVVNDILDFARIETGKLEIKSEDLRPLKVVEEVAELLAPQAQKKNLDLLVDVSPKIPTILQGDEARIRQVLVNLVGNAIKFTKKGEVTIQVRVERKNKTQLIVRFSITDTGIGIPKMAQHRLFQPFTQIDGSSTRPYGGTGLGLSIATRLVELMGGQIGYLKRKEKGSHFWFSIPLARSKQSSETDTLLEQSKKILKGVKILIVDRQQTSKTVILNQLLRWNMKGTAVESAEEIAAYLHHEAATGTPCSLVLVSSAPDADKQRVEKECAVARTVAQDPNLPSINLILLTGNNTKTKLEEVRKAGYNTILSKPLQRDQLLQTLVSLVQAKPEPQSRQATQQPHANDGKTTISSCRPVTWGSDQHKNSVAATKTENQCRILLAEDNAVIQKVTQMQLHRLGYAVHTVANGKEALEYMQSNASSLVLMDCHMPVMDGYQATQSIHNLPSDRAKAPIIGMLAKTVKGETKRCLDAGMDDVLYKPVEMENLKKMLDHWLKQKREHD